MTPIPTKLFTRIAIALGLALLPAMLVLAADFGVTWDELSRQANGERIWLRYQGQIDHRQAAPDAHLYGGLFDVAAVALQRAMSGDPYYVRHLLNAAFGWLGIVGCAVLGWRVGGVGTALLAGTLLALSPRYFGHSMNNPKDLPFAAAATWALVAMACLPQTFPYLPARSIVAVGTTVGLSLAIRPGGLLIVLYAFLWTLASIVRHRDWHPWHAAASALGMAAMLGLAITVSMPVWPFLWEQPLTGVFQAAEQVSHFQWSGYVLFAGRDVPSTALPWTYAPVWLLATTPPVILAGALLSITVPIVVSLGARTRGVDSGAGTTWGGSTRHDVSPRFLAGLLFAVLFPIAYVILRGSTMYDGIRHLLFVVPPLTVLAAAGWSMTMTRARPGVRRAAGVLLAVGLLEPLLFQVRNHPNQVVYFQPLMGGPRAAFGRFELDYWGNCLFQAVQHVGRVARAAGRPVAISGAQWRMLHLDARRVPQVFVIRPKPRRHELEITLLRGAGNWLLAFEARPDLLWQVTTYDGTPLCAVTPGPQFAGLRRRLEPTGALPSLLPGVPKRP